MNGRFIYEHVKQMTIGVCIGTTVMAATQWTYNTFLQPNTSKLEITREIKKNKTAGAVFIQDNKIYFRTFEDLLENDRKLLEKKVFESKKIKKRFSEKSDKNTDISNGRGSGSCIKYNGINYILTNEHVVNGISKNRETKLISNEKLDVSLIPFTELENHTISSLEDCLKLVRTEEILNKEYTFIGWGRDLYQSSGIIQKDIGGINQKYKKLALIYDNNSYNPLDVTFPNNFPGTSGSTLFDENEKVLGVFKSVSSFALLEEYGPVRNLHFPMNKTSGYFTQTNDIIDWLEKSDKSGETVVNFSNLNEKLDNVTFDKNKIEYNNRKEINNK